MIIIKWTGAIILLVIAVFFLSNGQLSDSTISNTGDSVSRMDLRPESDYMGVYTNIGIRSNPNQFSSISSENQTIRLMDVAIVYANITSTAHMIAVVNNSLLNAKYSVYVLAQENIIVNGIHIIKGETREWTKPLPSSLFITFNQTLFVVRLRQVASLDDIEDTDRPVNETAQYYFLDLVNVSVAGIPATLASLAFWIVLLVLIKSQNIQKGLPDGI